MDSKRWDEYSEKFNLLSDKMASAGIDTKELIDLLKAYENFSNSYKSST